VAFSGKVITCAPPEHKVDAVAVLVNRTRTLTTAVKAKDLILFSYRISRFQPDVIRVKQFFVPIAKARL